MGRGGKKVKKGDKVRTIDGKIETIMAVIECAVFTYESPNAWYHITKVFMI